MLKKILISFSIILILCAVFVALQPAHYRVERTTSISAPAVVVFTQVNDFHNWEGWSPWAKLDPAMKQTYEGPAAGTGAIYTWVGNNKVGEGRMTLIESRPSDLIRIKLEFVKPFPSTCATEFEFKPKGNQTAVTWNMTGENNFMAKAFCLFMNMDKTVGGDFEKGLARMKSVVEAAALRP